ncbi:MAG: DNA polymerase I [bacterium]|nr:DNA polymerase I [bacterium]
MPKLLLIDAFSLAFRAFYAYPPTLTLEDGTPSNAIYGFASLVFQAIDQIDPDFICVCFDRKEPTFRHTMYTEYKGHRPPPPEEFSVQVPYLFKIIEELGLHQCDLPGYEADDVIGTLATRAQAAGMQSFIFTGDQDSFQLVTDAINVVTPKRGSSSPMVYTPCDVREKMGLGPESIVDYKALKGDASDNIPGVKGIGDKTAVSLLTEYGDLDGVYANLDSISSKSVRSKLETDKEKAYLSRKLATICREVPIDCDVNALHYEPEWGSIIRVFDQYQFKTLSDRFSKRLSDGGAAAKGLMIDAAIRNPGVMNSTDTHPGLDPGSSGSEFGDLIPPDGSYQLIETESALKQLLLFAKDGFAIDLETTGLQIAEAEIVGVALSFREKKAYYIPMNAFVSTPVPETQSLPMFDLGSEVSSKIEFKRSPLLDLLVPFLEDDAIPKYTHNGKYEQSVLSNYGIQLRGISFDTMLAAFLLDPLERVGLKACAKRYLGIAMTEYETVAGKGKDQHSFTEVPLAIARDYAAADADMTLRLKGYFEPKIKDGFSDIFYNIELPTQMVLSEMESQGVHIDVVYLKELHVHFEAELELLEARIHTLAGRAFNIASPKQLGEILFESMGIEAEKKTKTGYSTDSSVLEKLAPDHPIASEILRYRGFAKLLNTYVDSLPKLISPQSGRIHTSFNQASVATGRLSSTNPNLQNIPIRTNEGLKIRGAFVPTDASGFILSADYSQVELRVLAHLAEDENMIDAFKKGEDIHQATAALIYQIDYNSVTKDQRAHAKAVNFGITYGQGAFALADQLDIKRKDAQEIIDSYYGKFKRIRQFIDETKIFAKENGFVTTMFGRVRPLPDISSSQRQKQSFSERIAVNTRVQGTAAEIMKLAMICVRNALLKSNLKSKMVIQVHDELVFDGVVGEEQALRDLVVNEMSNAAQLSVPLVVDAELGKSWSFIGD